MATIAGVTGKQFTQESADYSDVSYQYATSSFLGEDRMKPALIVQPNDKNDIALTLKYAKSKNIAVAIRTGGHQYCGASSTSGANIQLDLKMTFRGPDDRAFFEKDGKAYVRTSVSWALGEFNAYLGSNQVFVPHGQCVNVHVGGHVQTGGYGQLGRSFGLLGDHVISLEIVDHAGNFKEVTKNDEQDLFYAILGGSPGNFGVITHFTIEVHRDSDYEGSRGLKAIYWYSPENVEYLLSIVAEMADNPDYPRNYDFCVSVLSSSFQFGALLDHSLDKEMKDKHPQYFGTDGTFYWPRLIIVYAQWVPFEKTDVWPQDWFDRINKKSLVDIDFHVQEKPMSQLTSEWIFRNIREFDHPYVKSTHMTKSTTLGKDGWPAWLAGRIDALVKPENNGCYLSAQIQCFGGKYARFTANADNGTSYSWRDSTVCCTLDAFYDGDGARDFALGWHKINEEEGVGPNGKFSTEDRRVLWGSFGEYDLDAVWQCYYDDETKYKRLQKARQLADPDGTLTPNTFCVKK